MWASDEFKRRLFDLGTAEEDVLIGSRSNRAYLLQTQIGVSSNCLGTIKE